MLTNLLYGHSLFFTAIIVVGFWIVISLIGHWITHRLIALTHRRSHNDVIGFEKRSLHLASTILIAVTLGLVIFLIVAFDYPFRGEMKISPAPFERVLERMKNPKA